jgi:hypothetical protein
VLRTSAAVFVVLLGGIALVGVTGCEHKNARQATGVVPPSPTAEPTDLPPDLPPTDPPAPPPIPSPVASASGPAPFGEAFAVSCAGRPSADQVIALLRRTHGLLPASATVTVRMGPLCAGTWQYTVVALPEREPLQVVTKGTPSALTLVTAGTDVCVVPVRVGAPQGILTVAHCA